MVDGGANVGSVHQVRGDKMNACVRILSGQNNAPEVIMLIASSSE